MGRPKTLQACEGDGEGAEKDGQRSKEKKNSRQIHLSVDAVAMSDRLDLRTSLVNRRVDQVARLVDRELSTVGVRASFRRNENEAGDGARTVMEGEGVHPVL